MRWRWVPGYVGSYEVSDTGRVRSYRKRGPFDGNAKTPRIVGTRSPNPDGYMRAQLSQVDGPKKTVFVHDCVLSAFVGPRPPGQEARHLDGNPANNQLDNLCWSTHRDNIADKHGHGTMARGERAGRSKLREVDIIHIRQLRKAGLDTVELGAMYGVSNVTISHIARGVTWKHVAFTDNDPASG